MYDEILGTPNLFSYKNNYMYLLFQSAVLKTIHHDLSSKKCTSLLQLEVIFFFCSYLFIGCCSNLLNAFYEIYYCYLHKYIARALRSVPSRYQFRTDILCNINHPV